MVMQIYMGYANEMYIFSTVLIATIVSTFGLYFLDGNLSNWILCRQQDLNSIKVMTETTEPTMLTHSITISIIQFASMGLTSLGL